MPFEGLDIVEIISMVILYFVSLMIAGPIYGKFGSKAWKTRGERGDYDGTLIRVYNKSPIRTDIKNISGSIKKEMTGIKTYVRDQLIDLDKVFSSRTLNLERNIDDKINGLKSYVDTKFERLEEDFDELFTEVKTIKTDFDPQKVANKIRVGLGGEKGGMIRTIVAEEKDMAQAYAALTEDRLPYLKKGLQDLDTMVDLKILTKEKAEWVLKLANSPRWQPKAEEFLKGIYKDNGNRLGQSGSTAYL